MENKNIEKFLNYNTSFNNLNSDKRNSNFNDFSKSNTHSRNSELTLFNKLNEISSNINYQGSPLFEQFLKYENKPSLLSSESDNKQMSNPLKYLF
jgi:hypothetical protein